MVQVSWERGNRNLLCTLSGPQFSLLYMEGLGLMSQKGSANSDRLALYSPLPVIQEQSDSKLLKAPCLKTHPLPPLFQDTCPSQGWQTPTGQLPRPEI